MSADPKQNTICSPLSALMPIGKLALGAEGKALDELLGAIGVSKTSKIRSHFKSLIVELRYLPGGKLDIASRLYVSDATHLHKSFVNQTKDIFGSSVVKIDFQYPTYVADEINSWVSSQTNYMIKDVVEPLDIIPSTSLVLINAVYFSGKWQDPFDIVQNKTFYTPMNWIIAPMMTRSGMYNYKSSDVLAAQIIQIPYMGNKASFIVVLPTATHGLTALLSQLKLAPELLDTEMSKMVETPVELSLPKFKIESKINLKDLYEGIGVKQVFSNEDSGLTKILRDKTVHVTTAKQKAFIEIHQFGSEAGASSAISVAMLSFHKSETFNADHPFLFFILVNKQQLFSGTVVYPQSN